MIYFLDSTKVPFIISHAHHAHVLLFLPCTVLSQSVLLGIRFIHKTFFFLFGEGGGGRWAGLCPLSPHAPHSVAGKCNPWLYFTPQSLALGDRSGKISTPGCGPLVPPDLYCTPQFLVTGGYRPHPWRLIRTPVQGGYPRYHAILSPPRRASLLVPLPVDLSASLPPEFCQHFLCVFCVVPGIQPLCEPPSN